MIFNQFEFLFVFLPCVLVAFFLTRGQFARLSLLVAASLIFYGIAGIEHAIVLVCGILWVHITTTPNSIRGDKVRLTLAITGPLLALTYYKYSQFLIRQVFNIEVERGDIAFSLFDNILLPAGISFFTFQLVAYAIDRYRGDIENPVPLADFALYISFFPQLVAGPIVRFAQVSSAIRNIAEWRPASTDIWRATKYVTIGLAAKILIADTLSRYVAPMAANPEMLSPGAAVYLIFGYSFQIYFDFYGYSLIAIGLGQLFGFQLPQNFLRPYESCNPRDFWRRWHVSLSFWIRDYLYIPLGGRNRHLLNILIIFVVCGLWHGADWSFIVWGFYHAILVTGYGALSRWWDRPHRIFQIAMTFMLVSLGWVLFVFDLPGTAEFFFSLFGGGASEITAPAADAWGMLLIGGAVCFGVRIEPIAERLDMTRTARGFYAAGFALLFMTSLLFLDVSDTFIYFRF